MEQSKQEERQKRKSPFRPDLSVVKSIRKLTADERDAADALLSIYERAHISDIAGFDYGRIRVDGGASGISLAESRIQARSRLDEIADKLGWRAYGLLVDATCESRTLEEAALRWIEFGGGRYPSKQGAEGFLTRRIPEILDDLADLMGIKGQSRRHTAVRHKKRPEHARTL